MTISRAERERREALLVQGLKSCSKCRETKTVVEFSTRSAAKDGLSPHCRKCDNSKTSEWYRDNRERAAVMNQRWRDDNQERRREVNRRWYAANYDPVRESTRRRRYREGNPLQPRLSVGAYRAHQLGCEVEQFDSIDLELFWLVNGISTTRCYYTGEALGDGWHLDHMVPLSRGGSHSVDNLVPCTPAANKAKGDQTSEEYLNVFVG